MGRFSEHTPFRRVDIRSTGAVFRRLAPHFDSRTSSEFDPCGASCARPATTGVGRHYRSYLRLVFCHACVCSSQEYISDASSETRLGYISSKQATLLWCRDFGQFDLVSLVYGEPLPNILESIRHRICSGLLRFGGCRFAAGYRYRGYAGKEWLAVGAGRFAASKK